MFLRVYNLYVKFTFRSEPPWKENPFFYKEFCGKEIFLRVRCGRVSPGVLMRNLFWEKISVNFKNHVHIYINILETEKTYIYIYVKSNINNCLSYYFTKICWRIVHTKQWLCGTCFLRELTFLKWKFGILSSEQVVCLVSEHTSLRDCLVGFRPSCPE